MKKEKNTQKRCCANCIKGILIPLVDDILCRKKGVVSVDYVCSGHKFTPMPRSPRELNFKCCDCENFLYSISMPDEEESYIGMCQLFSTRPFSGSKKNACSKFIMRHTSEVG